MNRYGILPLATGLLGEGRTLWAKQLNPIAQRAQEIEDGDPGKLQRVTKLSITDKTTDEENEALKLIKQRRCGAKDLRPVLKRTKRFTLRGTSWNSKVW